MRWARRILHWLLCWTHGWTTHAYVWSEPGTHDIRLAHHCDVCGLDAK